MKKITVKFPLNIYIGDKISGALKKILNGDYTQFQKKITFHC
jgi:hypothetical protein